MVMADAVVKPATTDAEIKPVRVPSIKRRSLSIDEGNCQELSFIIILDINIKSKAQETDILTTTTNN